MRAPLVLAAALLAAPAAADPVSRLVVFGDSNVDVGRLAAEMASDPADGRLPPPGTVGERLSDGPLLPEHAAEALGVPMVSHAWAGATAGQVNLAALRLGLSDALPTGTLAQIDEFEAGLPDGAADARALYLVAAGSNDLFPADKDDPAAVDAAVAGATANLEAAVRRLDGLGARRIVLVARTPRPVLSDAPRPDQEPDPAARDDAAGRQFNAALAGLAAGLDAELAAQVSLLDAYAAIREIVEGSGAPGGFEPYSADPSRYCVVRPECGALVNYDHVHKTSAVHAVLARRLLADLGLAPAR